MNIQVAPETRYQPTLDGISESTFRSAHDIFQSVSDYAVEQTSSDFGFLHLVNEVKNELVPKIWSGTLLQNCRSGGQTVYPFSDTFMWAKSIKKRETVIENECSYEDIQVGVFYDQFAVSRLITCPIFTDGRIVAVFGVGNRSEPYSEKDEERIEEIATSAWSHIQKKLNAKDDAQNKRQDIFENERPSCILTKLMKTVGKTLEFRDQYTSFHQVSVAKIATQIGSELGLSEQRLYGLNIGALIHDIGKIAIPSAILNKSGQLMPVEFELIKLHPTYGAELFSGLDLPWPIEEIIHQHHENLDGSGYPNGLKGSEICIEARIVAVADAFDAMSGDRPYRYAPGRDKAIAMLKEQRGARYDPYVVDSFLNCVEAGTI